MAVTTRAMLLLAYHVLVARLRCLLRGHRWWFERWESIPNPNHDARIVPHVTAPRLSCRRCGRVSHDHAGEPENGDEQFHALLRNLEAGEGRAYPPPLRVLPGGKE